MLMIRKAAVLGAGRMGTAVAAHLANAGIPTLLLDLPPTELTEDEQKKKLTLDSRKCATGWRRPGSPRRPKAARRRSHTGPGRPAHPGQLRRRPAASWPTSTG